MDSPLLSIGCLTIERLKDKPIAMRKNTLHRIVCQDARQLDDFKTESIDLVITSPPYPMIQMWDDLFVGLNPKIGSALAEGRGQQAFDMMHHELDRVWEQILRLLRPGGIACINVGDATRKLGNVFGLYANHARIIESMVRLGLTTLPVILWRKPTNAPNKFMGSGMYPPGAYVTLEHEHILIFRKGVLRSFRDEIEIQNRRESAYFWEERNTWFSDVWLNLPGSGQNLAPGHSRRRSAAFPFEIPYRLINMFSVKGDTVLDPFAGTGTSMAAAAMAGRNSIGVEIDAGLKAVVGVNVSAAVRESARAIESRLCCHQDFIHHKQESGFRFKYDNRHYHFPVMTRQETDLLIDVPASCTEDDTECISMTYVADPVQTVAAAIASPCSRAEGESGGYSVQGSRRIIRSNQRGLWDKS